MSEHRDNAQREADLDLAKEPRILLHDIHDELLRTDRKPETNLVHTSKRIASLHVKIAEKNDGLAIAQLDASTKAGELLDALKQYAAASENRSEKNEKDMRQLNRRMLWLTVAGVVLALTGAFLGGGSLWYARKADLREELNVQKDATTSEHSSHPEGGLTGQPLDTRPIPSDSSKPAAEDLPLVPTPPHSLPQNPLKAAETEPTTKEK